MGNYLPFVINPVKETNKVLKEKLTGGDQLRSNRCGSPHHEGNGYIHVTIVIPPNR